MVQKTTYALTEVLEILDVTVEQLREMTGLGGAAVRRAVMGGSIRTSDAVADAIATALGMHESEIEWPSGRTHLGRPAFTGKPISPTEDEVSRDVCPDCHLLLPLTRVCSCA